MGLLRNNALIEHPYLRTMPTNPEGWDRFIKALNDQSVEGTAISGAIEVVSALPTLPDTAYPVGSVVFLDTDDKLYRNTDGSTWSKAVDGGDITANTILTNSIGAGQVTAAKISVSTLSAISADMGTLTTGEINLSSGTAVIRSGQTAYDTGTGFWLERNGGTPRFSIGNASGNKLTWNGSTLAVTGALNFTNSVSTFTPSWTGFSSSPSGDLSYLDLGNIVFLYNANGSDMTGTSNTNAMTFTNLPSGIRPASERLVPCTIINNDFATTGEALLGSGGTVTFLAGDVNNLFGSVDATTYNVANFNNANGKGVPSGWVIIYPK